MSTGSFGVKADAPTILDVSGAPLPVLDGMSTDRNESGLRVMSAGSGYGLRLGSGGELAGHSVGAAGTKFDGRAMPGTFVQPTTPFPVLIR